MDLFKALFLFFIALVTVLANALVGVVVVWVICSVMTSGLKSANKDCGKQYSIESYGISGDLFCEKKIK